jgi:hypothetical protein
MLRLSGGKEFEMSDALNALIAFAGFLMLFSILVTSFQNGLKSFLNLKTGVWERFFIGIYKHDFGFDTKSEEGGTTYKERRLLPFVGEYDNRLKRLRDMLVEAEEPFKKLEEALENIVRIDPESPEAARVIANHLSPLKDALFQVKGLRLDSLLTMYEKVSGMDIQGFYENIRSLEAQFPALRRNVEKAEQAVLEEFILKCRQLDDFINEYGGMLFEYKIQIEKKADAWLAQLNQEYKKNMLKWTVVIGTVLVLAFNADSFNIFRFLLNDTESRKAIVSVASETVVTAQKSRAEDLNAIDKAIGGENLSEAVSKLTAFLQKISDDFNSLGALGEVKKAASLIEQIKKIEPPEKKAEMQGIYDKTVPLFVVLQKATLDDQLQGIAALDLPLGWGQEGKRLAAAMGPGEYFLYFCSKIGGLFLTSVLITFGAPFWKDVMNALAGAKKVIPKTAA